MSLLRGERRLGREEGKEEGKKEGKKEERNKIATEMLQSGFDKRVIMDLTKLSEEEFRELFE